MSLKSRLERIENEIGSPNEIPIVDRLHVIIHDGRYNPEERMEEISQQIQEKYGTTEGLDFLHVVFVKATNKYAEAEEKAHDISNER